MFASFGWLIAAGSTPTGETFRKILPYALIGVIVLCAAHLVFTLVRRKKVDKTGRYRWWEMLIYLGTVGCIAVLAATSFIEMLRSGALLGWPLFVHMFAAGAFVGVLPLLAVTWCHFNTYGCCPRNVPKTGDSQADPSGDAAAACRSSEPSAGRFSCTAKTLFWIVLAGGFVVTMTMLVSMLPLFGTDGLHTLINVHRYAGLVVVLALIAHIYAVAIRLTGLR
jgi:hypothetical protein